MTNIAKIKAARASRANTVGRNNVDVLAGLGAASVVAYSTVVVPTRFALVYGIVGAMTFGLTLITTTVNLGLA